MCVQHGSFVYSNGGEPTLIKAHWNYLRRLVESGRSKNIILWYNINMTNLSDEAIPYGKNLKKQEFVLV